MGALLAAFPLLLFALGLDKEKSVQTISTIVNLIIIFSVLYVGIKAQRETMGNGYITFGSAFGTGFKMTLIASVISAVNSYLYFTVINPGMATFIKMQQEEELMERGMSDEQVAQISASMDMWLSPPVMALFALGGMILLGTVISLIVSAILKKEDPSAMMS
jgi:hypothetical protein